MWLKSRPVFDGRILDELQEPVYLRKVGGEDPGDSVCVEIFNLSCICNRENQTLKSSLFLIWISRFILPPLYRKDDFSSHLF